VLVAPPFTPARCPQENFQGMAHYYDTNAHLSSQIDAANHQDEVLRREKVGKARMVRMEAAVTACLEKYKGLKKLYKINSNFKHADQRENDMGIAKAKLRLAQIYRISALEKEDSDPGRDKDTAKARAFCDEAALDFEALDDQMGIANCHVENAKVSLAFKDLYPKNIKEFEENVKNLMDAMDYYHQAHEIFDWLHATKSLARVEEQLQVIKADISFCKKMITRLRIAKHGPTEKDEDQEEAEEFKQEADSVRAVFNKFDADRSGAVDMTEFHEIAATLGTFPPLTKQEGEEVIMQLGKKSVDAKLTWDEFLTWWISGEILLQERGAEEGRLGPAKSQKNASVLTMRTGHGERKA
jgi:hypothetical protein